jgi:hypothetical protein
MPYKTDLAAFVADWWQFGVFLAGAVIAFGAGRERQRYRLDQVGREVKDQGDRIEALEKQGNAEAVQLAQIVTTQQHILRALEEIKESLKGKADK